MKPMPYAAATAILALAGGSAQAEIKACISVSSTGPASAQGIPQANTVSLFPDEIAGEKVSYVIFDDASDPTVAVRNVKKCIEQQGADVIMGGTVTPTSIALAGVATDAKTPILTLAPIPTTPDVDYWTFRSPQNVDRMATAIIDDMKASGFKTLGFIGYTGSYGDQWDEALKRLLPDTGIALGPSERFERTDTSVTAQALKLKVANPDAILVVAGGTPAALPNLALAEVGYEGQIYHTHGSASKDFIRVAGKSAEGTRLPVGPMVVAAQLPDAHPSRSVALKYISDYEAKFGQGTVSSNGGYMLDIGIRFTAAVPDALKNAQPGSPEFRAALRDALENINGVAGVHGVYATSATDHFGHDPDGAVMVVIENGDWLYLPANK